MDDKQRKAMWAGKGSYRPRIHDNKLGIEIERSQNKPTLPKVEKNWKDMSWREQSDSNREVFNRVNEDSDEFVKQNIYQYQVPDSEHWHDRIFGCKHCDKKYRSNSSDQQSSASVMGKQVKHLVKHVNKKHGIGSTYDQFTYRRLADAKEVPQLGSYAKMNNLSSQLTMIIQDEKLAKFKKELDERHEKARKEGRYY